MLDVLGLYEQAGPSWRPTRPELVQQVDELADEFDLAYVKENMGKLLESTRQGVKRVADIVQNLRGFARLDHAAVEQADIHEAIRTALEMLRGRLDRREITVEEHLGDFRLGGRLARAAQPGLLEPAGQRHAGDRGDPSRRRPDRDHHRGADDGEIVVEVADNGCGIPDDILPQIFDPFFTTKDVGDGTGLGLSITHGMVQDHGGRLEVESVSARAPASASSCRRPPRRIDLASRQLISSATRERSGIQVSRLDRLVTHFSCKYENSVVL